MMQVLIAEDEPISRKVLEDSLRSWGYDVIVAKTGDQAWEVLKREDSPNLAILDWVMPGLDGLEICRRIRAQNTPGYVYIILLTAKSGREDIIRGLESGADDYIIKPFYREELKCRLKNGERIIKLEQNILHLAMTDYLTGLLNRRAFLERMEAELKRSIRENRALGIIIVDIDHFKKVNDSYGHQAGDVVLQHFAQCLVSSCRAYDFIGRYGGEEFIICIPGANLKQTAWTAERIRMTIYDNEFLLPEQNMRLKITASLGISAMESGIFKTADQLINQADDALYRAKAEGRNQVGT